jgi:hypothetical protein
MKDQINLKLKAKHFKDTIFVNNTNCAIAKAAKEQFKVEKVSEGIDTLYVRFSNFQETEYKHEYYGDIDFNQDLEIAKKHNYDDTIIRKIELNKI